MEQDRHVKFLVLVTFSRACDSIRSCIGDIVNSGSTEHQNAHDEHVPDGHSVDLAPNDVANNLSVFGSRSLLHDVSEWWGGSQSECGHSVHDKVDPEEHDSVQRRLKEVNVPNNDYQQATQVTGNLELQEPLDVGVDITAPHDRLGERDEVIFNQDHVGGLFGQTAPTSHSEGDIGGLEGFDIVHAFPDDDHFAFHILQAGSNNIFVDGVSSGNYFEIVYHLSESLHVLRLVSLVTFIISDRLESTDSFSELRCKHGVLIVVRSHT